MTSPLHELGRAVGETADAVNAPRAERDVEHARTRLVGAREGTVTLARDVAASQDALLCYDDTLGRARARLLAKPRRRRGYQLPQLLRVAVPLSLCLVAALLIVSGLRPGDDAAKRPALSYVVGEHAGAVGQRVVAFEARQTLTPELRFSDGSTIDLETPASTALVTALDARGARVKIERGAARIFVNPRRITRWRVSAGPFTVHVVGTRFRVAWDGASKRFALAMTRGKVRVEGPVIGERVLRAGQRLDVDLSRPIERARVRAASSRAAPKRTARGVSKTTSARRLTPPRAKASRRLARRPVARPSSPGARSSRQQSRDEPAPSSAAADAKSSSADEPKLAHDAPAPPPTSGAANATGATQRAFAAIAAGRFCAGNKLLDAAAVAKLLARAPAQRLLALGDAARYCRATQRARAAYGALWRRFARSPSAAAAALALARLSLARRPLDAASATRAVRWLDRVTAAHGATAAQQRMAAARRVELHWTRGQRARACGLAQLFLSRWPAGSAARYVKQVALRCRGTAGQRKQR